MRRILVLSTVCSKEFYKKVNGLRIKPVLDTQQKFLTSIVAGINKHEDITVDCISIIPVSRSNYPNSMFKPYNEVIDGVNYHYVGFVNYPVLKNITSSFTIAKAVMDYCHLHQSEDICVLSDSLSVEVSLASLLLKKRGVSITAIVTDIPLLAETMGTQGRVHKLYSKLYGTVANQLLLKYDKYILLSKYMNDIVNPTMSKPYMLMECIIDEHLFDGIDSEHKQKRPAVMYAGKFYRECGVIELAKAALELRDICDVWLYGGHGDCLNELKDIEKRTDNLLIHDIVPLEEILKLEKQCSLLINPRFSEEEFSKYSFPSKTAEYMLSGTPVLMYRLPSLPDEYIPYVYLIETEGIAQTIRTILSGEEGSMISKGLEASNFIKYNKNNENQAKRIVDFLS